MILMDFKGEFSIFLAYLKTLIYKEMNKDTTAIANHNESNNPINSGWTKSHFFLIGKTFHSNICQNIVQQ